MKRKVLLFVLAMYFCIGLCSQPALAHLTHEQLIEEVTDDQGVVYGCYNQDGYLCAGVIGYTDELAAQVIIPAEVNGYPVVSIEMNAFEGSSLNAIVMGENVKTISSEAFLDCTELARLVLTPVLRNFSNDCVSGCTALTEIVMENSDFFKTMDGVLYEKKTGGKLTLTAYPAGKTETSFTLPADVTYLSHTDFTPFGANPYLEEILVEEGSMYTSIDGILYSEEGAVLEAYPSGKKDSEFTIPDMVTEIAPFAFCETIYLKSLTIPDTVTSVGDWTHGYGSFGLDHREEPMEDFMAYCSEDSICYQKIVYKNWEDKTCYHVNINGTTATALSQKAEDDTVETAPTKGTETKSDSKKEDADTAASADKSAEKETGSLGKQIVAIIAILMIAGAAVVVLMKRKK